MKKQFHYAKGIYRNPEIVEFAYDELSNLEKEFEHLYHFPQHLRGYSKS